MSEIIAERSLPQEGEPQIRKSSVKGLQNSVLGTRNLMTVAVLGIVGAMIVVPLTYMNAAIIVDLRGAYIAAITMGLWSIPYLLPMVIVKRPGAIIVASLIMGIIGMFTTPMGVMSIAGNLFGGIMAGIVFPLTLYKIYNWVTYSLGAIVFGGLNGAMFAGAYSLAASTGDHTAFILLGIASSLLGVVVMLIIERVLRKMGVGLNAPFTWGKAKS